METITISTLIGLFTGLFSGDIGAAIVGATLGATMSGFVIRLHENNLEIKKRAVDLIQEYSSPEFIQIRNDAGVAFRAALQDESNNSWESLFHSLSQEEWQKISKIEHFYKKLDFLVSIGEVDKGYIKLYFKDEFLHWEGNYFSKVREKGNTTHENLYKLSNSMSFSELVKGCFSRERSAY